MSIYQRLRFEITNGIPGGIPHHLLPTLDLDVLLNRDVGPALTHNRSKVLESAPLLILIRARVGEEAYLGVFGLHVLDQPWRCLGRANPDNARNDRVLWVR